MKTVDKGLQETSQGFCKIENCHVSMEGVVRDLGAHLDIHVEELKASVGKKPLRLDSRFDAPNL